MILKDYGEIEIQKDLDSLLSKVQKELKKKMFPRKHIKLLWNDTEICLENLGEKSYVKNCLGEYEAIEDEEHKYKFKHKIILNEWVYNEYKNGIWGIGTCKRYCKQRIKNVIAHELIHAYVNEKYSFNDGAHRDGSPIFLGIISYLKTPSGHPSMRAFMRTGLYKQIMQCENFDKVENLLLATYFRYDKKFRELNFIKDKENKIIYENNFEFAHGDIGGIYGISTITAYVEGLIYKLNTFQVGVMADIETFNDQINRKVKANNFKYKYVTNDKKHALKVQSMNI